MKTIITFHRIGKASSHYTIKKLLPIFLLKPSKHGLRFGYVQSVWLHQRYESLSNGKNWIVYGSPGLAVWANTIMMWPSLCGNEVLPWSSISIVWTGGCVIGRINLERPGSIINNLNLDKFRWLDCLWLYGAAISSFLFQFSASVLIFPH